MFEELNLSGLKINTHLWIKGFYTPVFSVLWSIPGRNTIHVRIDFRNCFYRLQTKFGEGNVMG